MIWNSKFDNYSDRIFPIEPEIKDTTDTIRFASCIDLHLEIDREGQLRAKIYDKICDFTFLIVKHYFILSNISAAPANVVYI